MQIIKMKLSELVRPKKNVRIHAEQQLKEFERSIEMFGQIRPIVVDENNVILAGNGLYETLIRMGRKEADVYKYTDLTENQKKKLMIADNKIFNLGIDNLETLNSFLDDLKDDLDIPGYDSDILKQMVSDADEITEKISEYGTLDEEEIEKIKEKNQKVEEREAQILQNNENEEQHNSTPESNVVQEEHNEDTADVKKFVICPKCGEKIWL